MLIVVFVFIPALDFGAAMLVFSFLFFAFRCCCCLVSARNAATTTHHPIDRWWNEIVRYRLLVKRKRPIKFVTRFIINRHYCDPAIDGRVLIHRSLLDKIVGFFIVVGGSSRLSVATLDAGSFSYEQYYTWRGNIHPTMIIKDSKMVNLLEIHVCTTRPKILLCSTQDNHIYKCNI